VLEVSVPVVVRPGQVGAEAAQYSVRAQPTDATASANA